MKKFMTLMVAAGLVIGASTFAFGQEEKKEEKEGHEEEEEEEGRGRGEEVDSFFA